MPMNPEMQKAKQSTYRNFMLMGNFFNGPNNDYLGSCQLNTPYNPNLPSVHQETFLREKTRLRWLYYLAVIDLFKIRNSIPKGWNAPKFLEHFEKYRSVSAVKLYKQRRDRYRLGHIPTNFNELNHTPSKEELKSKPQALSPLRVLRFYATSVPEILYHYIVQSLTDERNTPLAGLIVVRILTAIPTLLIGCLTTLIGLVLMPITYLGLQVVESFIQHSLDQHQGKKYGHKQLAKKRLTESYKSYKQAWLTDALFGNVAINRLSDPQTENTQPNSGEGFENEKRQKTHLLIPQDVKRLLREWFLIAATQDKAKPPKGAYQQQILPLVELRNKDAKDHEKALKENFNEYNDNTIFDAGSLGLKQYLFHLIKFLLLPLWTVGYYLMLLGPLTFGILSAMGQFSLTTALIQLLPGAATAAILPLISGGMMVALNFILPLMIGLTIVYLTSRAIQKMECLADVPQMDCEFELPLYIKIERLLQIYHLYLEEFKYELEGLKNDDDFQSSASIDQEYSPLFNSTSGLFHNFLVQQADQNPIPQPGTPEFTSAKTAFFKQDMRAESLDEFANRLPREFREGIEIPTMQQ